MKLYEIKETILNGVVFNENGDVVNPETGEKLTKEEFEALGVEFSEGIENLCLWVKDLRAEAKAIKEEKKNLDAREKAAEKKADSIEKYVAFLLDGNKFETAKCIFKYSKSEKCVCSVPAEQLPEEFQRVKQSVEPNLTELKAYIKAGNTVKGVEIITEMKGSVK